MESKLNRRLLNRLAALPVKRLRGLIFVRVRIDIFGKEVALFLQLLSWLM